MFQRPIILLIRKPIITSFLLLVTLALFWLGALNVTTVLSPGLENKVIVIDPGHGGVDPGAQSSGISEKDINLDISLRLRRQLESKGCKVIMTRDSDTDFFIPGFYEGRKAKRVDLNHRINLAAVNNADVFISIHTNSYTKRATYGMETFYYQKSPTGKFLANQIQEHITELQPGKKRQAKAGDYYLINQTTMPAVIVEVGFISNPRERKLLLTGDYQDSIAKGIADGIQSYFEAPAEIRSNEQSVANQEGPPPICKNSYKVYFTNSNLDSLVPEERIFNPAVWNKLSLTGKANQILNDLIKGPTSPDLARTVSANAKVLSVTLQNDIITLNLSKDIRDDFKGGAWEEDLTIKSIVWSMTQLPGVSGVCIAIDGEYGDSIGGNIVLDHVLNTRS